ncbi:DUF6478 family protein [Pseudooceanicola algae]|uniref:Uncharacterized protein n=1 Tax=Pseudooceanicola algae TaxID=1537215 RepID=A0A418SGI7_9RHOB|nr:DUF6478 family protein [Pseudooceanicola algae]QPM91790.1 hypothetical protein PSAL_030450 [Pseudooceanicola algae]
MALSIRSMLRRQIEQREFSRWRYRAATVEDTRLSLLRRQVLQAQRLRAELDQLIQVADSRLAFPAVGANGFDLPQDTDWRWRPALWRGPLPRPGVTAVTSGEELGEEVKLFHDCAAPEVTLRQMRNHSENDLAPFGLRMEVFGFTGSFLSLAVDLPAEAIAGLRRRHLVRVAAHFDLERPIEIFVRLNIKHGPNTEELVEPLPGSGPESMVEFDLAYSEINEKRIEKAWVDIIFGDPAMNAVALRDLTFSRRPRAEL